MMKRFPFRTLMILLSLVLLPNCAEVVQVGTTIGQGMGKISPQDKESIDRAAAQTAKAARPMTTKKNITLAGRWLLRSLVSTAFTRTIA